MALSLGRCMYCGIVGGQLNTYIGYIEYYRSNLDSIDIDQRRQQIYKLALI